MTPKNDSSLYIYENKRIPHTVIHQKNVKTC